MIKSTAINGDSTAYTYDPVGNVKTIDGPSGNTSYSYTAVNELYQIADPWGNNTTFAYQPTNDELLHTVSLPGSVTETYGYDNADRVTSFTAAHSGTNLISDSYDYFASGGVDSNLLQSSTNTAGQTTSYSYDPLERLTSASATAGGTSYSYTYNGDGDITSQDIGGTTTTSALNTNHENTADTYDTAGNLTWATGLGTLAYNSAGQTASITPSGGSAESLSYLTEGQTTPTTVGSTHLTYNALGIDGTTTGSSTNYFLRAPDGALLAEHTGGHPYYYLLDPNNASVDGLTNTSGSLVNSDSYSPYGVQTATLSGISNPFQYDSGYNVPGTTLLHFGERYYSPTTAGWTQLDPSGQGSGYVYAGDDPTSFSDPTGLCFIVSCSTYDSIGKDLVKAGSIAEDLGESVGVGAASVALTGACFASGAATPVCLAIGAELGAISIGGFYVTIEEIEHF